MSDPYKKIGIHNAISEIISGMSALNSPPDPIPASERNPEAYYLTEFDGMAKHSLVHFRAAIEAIRPIVNVEEKVYKFVIKELTQLIVAMKEDPNHSDIHMARCASHIIRGLNNFNEENF